MALGPVTNDLRGFRIIRTAITRLIQRKHYPLSMAKLATNAGFEVARIDTVRVKFHDKENTPRWCYALGKLAAEILNLPAQLSSRGHDMLAYLRKPSAG